MRAKAAIDPSCVVVDVMRIMWVEKLMYPGEGDHELSDKRSSDRLAGKDKSKVRSKRKPEGGSKAGDLGKALRSVYDNTLREEVPGDFLDLLGKLS